MKKLFKSIGGSFLISLGLGVLVLFAWFLIKGGVLLGSRVLPWCHFLGNVFFVLDLCLFLPLAIFKKTKIIAGYGLLVSSFVYGLSLWVWSLLLVYATWGMLAVFIGLFVAGIGQVPMALFALMLNKEWILIGEFVLTLVCIYGSRGLGLYFKDQAEATQFDVESSDFKSD